MRPKVPVKGPYPTLAEVAKRLGVPAKDAERIRKLAQAIVEKKKRRS